MVDDEMATMAPPTRIPPPWPARLEYTWQLTIETVPPKKATPPPPLYPAEFPYIEEDVNVTVPEVT
jgi:hypothetical protein